MYLPQGPHFLLASSAPSVTAEEQDRDRMISLISRLKSSIGDAWDSKWLSKGLPAIHRNKLAREMTLLIGGFVIEVNDDSLARRLTELLNVKNLLDAARLIKNYPELQSKYTENTLSNAALSAQINGDVGNLRNLTKLRDLVWLCRQVGPDDALHKMTKQKETINKFVSDLTNLPEELQAQVKEAFVPATQHSEEIPIEVLDALVGKWECILNHPAFTSAAESVQMMSYLQFSDTLSQRYKKERRLTDLYRAIDIYKQAKQIRSTDADVMMQCLGNMGYELLELYTILGDMNILEEGIGVFREALKKTPVDPRTFSNCLIQMGTALLYRFRHLGRKEDIEAAIHHFRESVNNAPPESSEFSLSIYNLGVGLVEFYSFSSKIEYLDEAIDIYRWLLDTITSNPEQRPVFLDALGGALIHRYRRKRRQQDLRDAIELIREAVSNVTQDSTSYCGYLTNLGLVLFEKYENEGLAVDLEEAIDHFQKAVKFTPPGSPRLASRLDKLALALRQRYTRTQRLIDLKEANQFYSKAISCLSKGSPLLPICLSNSGICMADLYSISGEKRYIEEAISSFEKAIDFSPPNSPDQPLYKTNLGIQLHLRYLNFGYKEDLDKSIAYIREAVQETPDNSRDLPLRLNNLGNTIIERFELSGRREDLDEAIQQYRLAVETTNEYSPYLASRLFNFAFSLSTRHIAYEDPDDLRKALDSFKQADANLDKTFALSAVTYQLAHQARWAEIYTKATETYIKAATVWPNEAAHWKRAAFVLSEGCKSRLLTIHLRGVSIPAPPGIPTDFVEREHALLRSLSIIDTEELASIRQNPGGKRKTNYLSQIVRRKELIEKLRRMWDELSLHNKDGQDYVALRRGDRPDWNCFMRLPAITEKDTVFLSLFTSFQETRFFVLRAGMNSPEIVEASISRHEWNDILRRFYHEIPQYDFSGRRGETWHKALMQLANDIGPYIADAKHICIAPEGPGHYIPWGALGIIANWEAPVTSIPAIGLIEPLVLKPPSKKSGVLLVGNTTGNLRYAEAEVFDVAKKLKSTPLLKGDACKKKILEKLGEVAIAHFATHAKFDPESPFDSGIVLADGVLTAREIMEKGVEVPDFVVLSACQTGIVTPLGGNEIAGLCQAFLHAGARSLLVSLWSVNDLATAYLMSVFYDLWLNVGFDKSLALNEAMRSTRSARSEWSHTYYWGAFTLVGTPL